ncbi:MAG: tyrosine-type recombinase/integrase [Clostridiales bacterium]|nr:tyrosine-type recombinase/integrase [Clostridiales bacterium]MCF8021964.1 tyrosine-type recombinase/integrase [Clostridiales bacterium]
MLDSFKLYLEGQAFSYRSIYIYISTVRRFINWAESIYGEFDITAVTPLDIADYRRSLVDKERKPATINHALDILSSFFSWAVTQGIIQYDPTADVKRMHEQKNAPRWLARKELGTFVRTVQKYGKSRDMVMVMLLLHAGLRISEAVSLKIDDLVLKERSGIVKVYGKGDKYRQVPLNITVRRAIKNYLIDLEGKWLFPGREGNHMTTRNAEKILLKFSYFAGIDVTPHKLRHTFGKMLIDRGESLDRVAALMGHSNLNTTAKYTKPCIQDLEKAVERLAWE